MRIGFDFDNTIISYEKLFYKRAIEKNYLNSNLTKDLSKQQVKDYLVKKDQNDFKWQDLQADVYGEFILEANPFEFAIEVLESLKLQGHELFIISHKTERSNYRSDVHLHKWANLWLEKNMLPISKDNIFYCPTIDKKIQQISELNLDFYLDDLEKVLDHPNWPASTTGVHFTPHNKSNKSLNVSNWKEILPLIQIEQLDAKPLKNLQLNRNGNSKVVEIISAENKSYIVKYFFKQKPQERNRYESECDAIKLITKYSIVKIPEVILHDPVFKFIVFKKIKGNVAEDVFPKSQNKVESDLIHFLIDLKRIYNKEKNLLNYMEAADSKKCFQDYFEKIESRYESIYKNVEKDERLTNFSDLINNHLNKLKDKIFESSKKRIQQSGYSVLDELSPSQRTLNPSDFGPHNIIIDLDKNCHFFDFEYFGQDDTVKMLADLFHHVRNPMSDETKLDALAQLEAEADDPSLRTRLRCVIDLIGLEWILIVLNVCNKDVLGRRLAASKSSDIQALLDSRLQKAHEMVRSFKYYSSLI